VENNFVKRQLNNGINLFAQSTKKYTTTIVKVFIHQDLEDDILTKTSLLPFVLKRGCMRFPSEQKIRVYLEELYGTGFGVDVIKKGERHILVFEMDIVNEKFLPGKNNILKDGLLLLRDTVLDPFIKNGGFFKDYLDQERDILKREIMSLFNNKMQYAVERCFQEMCRDERYSLYRYGKIESLKDINEKNLYEYYLNLVKFNPIDIYIMGNIELDKDLSTIEEIFDFPRGKVKTIKPTFVNKEVINERVFFESQKIEQGKLSLGLRTYTTYGDQDYYPFLMANGILGGGPHSKLFQNVREKASLAYYIFSRIEKTKGLMLITSGIEVKNYDKALNIIKKQIDDLKDGNISDYEIEATRKMLINAFKEASDNPSLVISLYLDGIINNREENIEDMIRQIQTVNKEEIVKVSQKLKLDTIYFLTNKEIGKAGKQ
jgi:predicted Zn-dependent peptidase